MSMNPVHLGVNQSNVSLWEDALTAVAAAANATLNIPLPTRGGGCIPLLVVANAESGGPNPVGGRLWNTTQLQIVSYNEATGDLIVKNTGSSTFTGKVTAFLTAAS